MTSGYSVSRKASFPWISPLLSLLPPTTSLLRLGVEVLLVGLRTLKHGASLPHPISCLLSQEGPQNGSLIPPSRPEFSLTVHYTYDHIWQVAVNRISEDSLPIHNSIIWKSHKMEYNYANRYWNTLFDPSLTSAAWTYLTVNVSLTDFQVFSFRGSCARNSSSRRNEFPLFPVL